MGWYDFMESCYYRCDPAPYHTTIVSGNLVLTPENVLRFALTQSNFLPLYLPPNPTTLEYTLSLILLRR